MKILLATPPADAVNRYGNLSGAGSSQPNLGLLMLAASVRAAGHQPLLLDAGASALTRDEALRQAVDFAPDVIGLTATTLEVAAAARFADELRLHLPALRVVVGGPHVSAVPEETLQRFPAFDLAVVGEGEETLCELLDSLDHGRDLVNVAGLVLRDGAQLCATGRRPYLEDLDRLPLPAWDLLHRFPHGFMPPAFKVRRLPAASLVTSRGCPNRCIFCDRSVFGDSCHGYSATAVVTMIQELYERYGVREIAFEDDTFVTFRPRLIEICRQLVALPLELSWSCLGRVNHVDAETLALMKQAGCWQISFGIESGSQPILDIVRKNATLQQIRRAVELCREAGIKSKGFFIVGHPGETTQSLRQTIDFALDLPLDDLSVTMLTPFPGTELYDRAAEFGQFDADWAKMNLLNAVFVPHGLTADILVAAQRELLRRFYLRPRIVADYLGRLLRNPALLLPLLRGGMALLKKVR